MHERKQGIPSPEIPLFDGIKNRTVGEKAQLYDAGDSAKNLIVLRAGRVLVFNTLPNGKRVCDLILPPSFIGGETVLGIETYQDSARAFDSCLVQYVDRDSLNELLESQPSFTRSLFAAESARALRLSRRMKAKRIGVQASIARTLLDIAVEPDYFIYKVTHEIIGDIAGYTREMTSLVIEELQNRELIRMEGYQRKWLLRPDILAVIAETGLPPSSYKRRADLILPTDLIFGQPN